VATKRELWDAEESAWIELTDLIRGLSAEQLAEPGYLAEGWSIKDLLAHLACWMAEAQCALERIRVGTYADEDLDVDELNQIFYEVNRDQPLSVVRSELYSARNQMLLEWNALSEVTHDAEEWFLESGARHFDEHVPRLRAWIGELLSRGPVGPSRS
jgi:hypothetical protein